MTPERKKYLDNISKEEKVTRRFLEIYSNSMKHLKSYLNTADYKDIKGAKNAIAEAKAITQILKKQLPIPTRFGACVICGCKQPKGHIRFYSYSYCAECGQKLR